MSSAPRLTTCGIPAAPAAVSRSGPAVSTPPTRSSASSVVVRSSTPASIPDRARASSARPPEPVAWNTSTSYPSSVEAGAGGVDRGRRHPEHRRGDERTVSAAGDARRRGRRARGPSPAIAAAALPRRRGTAWLMPAMSTTLYIIVTSLAPTYGDTSPDGHRGDEELGQADRQVPHRAGGDGGPAAAAEREHAVEAPAARRSAQHDGRALAHRGHGGTAVVARPAGGRVEAPAAPATSSAVTVTRSGERPAGAAPRCRRRPRRRRARAAGRPPTGTRRPWCRGCRRGRLAVSWSSSTHGPFR